MKAGNLMVGDWINYCDAPRRVTAVMKDSVMVKMCATMDATAEGMLLSGVVLTEELVKANGLDLIDFFILRWNEERGMYRIDVDLPSVPGFGAFYVKYVHELQHVLRICKLYAIADDLIVY